MTGARTVAAVLLLVSCVTAQFEYLALGFCSSTPTKPGLDLQQFAGEWYTVARTPNQFSETFSCIASNYTLSGDSYDVVERGKGLGGRYVFVQTHVKSTGPDMPFEVQAKGSPVAPLKVIATNYANFACLQSCLQFAVMKVEFAWVLSRQPRDNAKAIELCSKILSGKAGVPANTIEPIPHPQDCQYRA